MASFHITFRIEGPGRVRSKLKIETATNEPFPDLANIVLESSLVDTRTHRLRIIFDDNTVTSPVENQPATSEPDRGFWERVRSRLPFTQLKLPL